MTPRQIQNRLAKALKEQTINGYDHPFISSRGQRIGSTVSYLDEGQCEGLAKILMPHVTAIVERVYLDND
jgi:hypothetical protein